MPWSETTPMDQRLQFVVDVPRSEEPFTALCARYGITPKTGYQWRARYAAEGPAGRLERSRRPHTAPTATAPASVAALLALRQRHPTWGPKKLVAVLARRQPTRALPAPRTVAGRRRAQAPRPHHRPAAPSRVGPPRPAAGADGRAERHLDGRLPGAVHDARWGLLRPAHHRRRLLALPARYRLACRALRSTAVAESRPVFVRLFREFGLPERIRSDNGVPFATIALGRLSALSAWWVRLGILPDLIAPAHPEQNGRHERMHRTLKAEATRPPAASCGAQQRHFDQFRREYNHERPHEALAQATPASAYTPSPRPYPERLPPLEYPAHDEVRRVSRNGGVRWHNQWVNVRHVLAEELVAFEEIADGQWPVYFGPLQLGRFNERTLRIEDQYGNTSRNPRRVLPMSSD